MSPSISPQTGAARSAICESATRPRVPSAFCAGTTASPPGSASGGSSSTSPWTQASTSSISRIKGSTTCPLKSDFLTLPGRSRNAEEARLGKDLYSQA
jgi:hypothetical protein